MIVAKILAIFLCLITFSYANPYLTAEPLEDIDYYVISIDGVQSSTAPSFDMIFLYSLNDLQDGHYNIEIICGHYNLGEGAPVSFIIEKSTGKKWIQYTIKKDPKQRKIDPYYDDRFETPMKIRINN